MRIAIIERHPDPKDNQWVVLNFPDDADIEVDVLEEVGHPDNTPEEDRHWAHGVHARTLTVGRLKSVLLRRAAE